MELNEIHTSHEEASVSLKVLLLILAILVIVTLGYFVWNQNHSNDTTAISNLVTTYIYIIS